MMEQFKYVNRRKSKPKEKLNIEDTIRFMGTADDINNYLQAMDLMLLPSLYEGFPVTVVEWQANGLP